jgi:hypothetical protein
MTASRRVSIAVALAAAVAVPSQALGDGLPVPVDGAGRARVVSGDWRYVTMRAGKGTVVERVKRAGGQVDASRFIRGKFTIPVVALDGTPGGLSHDTGTLVLVRPRSGFPRAGTTLALLDAQRLRVRRFVTLKGDFSFDALSPDGRTAFLIQYLSRRDPTRYAVRGLDAGTGKLLPGAIVDPHERGDAMRGYPMTRTAGPDGRWAYTLYAGAGAGPPFVHALDTRDRRAVCIDLPAQLASTDLWALRLRINPSGSRMTLARGKKPVVFVDTRTLEVTRAGDVPARRTSERTGGSVEPALIAVPALLLVAAAALVATRRRRRAAVSG